MTEKSRKNMSEIMETLEQGVADVFTSERYVQLLDFMGKFHNYSYGNCLLILSQCPSASHVASFQTWKKLGHPVKKGEKGIRVLVPIPYTYQKEQTTTDAKGNVSSELVDVKGLSFRIGHVFDASQVDGELPTLANELQDNPKILEDAVNQILSENENINYDSNLKKGGANGYYCRESGEICLRPNMSSLQTIKTMIHEKAHSLLHNADAEKYSREEAEVQAESVAYCVCAAFGLDTSDYSFGYIAGWSGGKETKELKSSLAVIEKTARELMHWLESASTLKLDAAI